MEKHKIFGKLLLYSEQGMEGGFLCLQELGSLQKVNLQLADVVVNKEVFDKHNPSKKGKISKAEVLIDGVWSDFVDPIYNDVDYKRSSFFCGELKADLDADKRLAKKYNFRFKYIEERLNETYGIGNWKVDGNLPRIIDNNNKRIYFNDVSTTIPKRPYVVSLDSKIKFSVLWGNGKTEIYNKYNDLLVRKWQHKAFYQLRGTDIIKVIHPKTDKVITEGQINKIGLKIFSHSAKHHFKSVSKKYRNSNWESYFNESFFAELYRDEKQKTTNNFIKHLLNYLFFK